MDLYIFDRFLGLPWNDLMNMMTQSIGLLYTKYLLMTVVVYIMVIIFIAVYDVMDSLVKYLFYFTALYMLFAKPISELFAWMDGVLKASGIYLPGFFS